jgi:protease-4
MAEENADKAVNEQQHGQATPWERDILEKLVLASVTEQRRARRWGIFFKSLFFIYLLIALIAAIQPFSRHRLADGKGHTAVVNVVGIIAEGTETNADNIIDGLNAAVEDSGTKGIILNMNTPGGSPVQSAQIYDEIRRIKEARPKLPIYAVVSDLCASGGYYVAAAADKIFVNSASVVGSIGVVMNGFGFVETIDKLGIERRLITAGEHKGMLDPFSPVNPVEKGHLQKLLTRVHQQFIDAVRKGRGERLKDNPDLFSGLVWTGAQGIELGLVDEVGDARSVAKNVIGAERLVNFTPEESVFDRLSHRIGTALGRLLWAAATSAVYR